MARQLTKADAFLRLLLRFLYFVDSSCCQSLHSNKQTLCTRTASLPVRRNDLATTTKRLPNGCSRDWQKSTPCPEREGHAVLFCQSWGSEFRTTLYVYALKLGLQYTQAVSANWCELARTGAKLCLQFHDGVYDFCTIALARNLSRVFWPFLDRCVRIETGTDGQFFQFFFTNTYTSARYARRMVSSSIEAVKDLEEHYNSRSKVSFVLHRTWSCPWLDNHRDVCCSSQY